MSYKSGSYSEVNSSIKRTRSDRRARARGAKNSLCAGPCSLLVDPDGALRKGRVIDQVREIEHARDVAFLLRHHCETMLYELSAHLTWLEEQTQHALQIKNGILDLDLRCDAKEKTLRLLTIGPNGRDRIVPIAVGLERLYERAKRKVPPNVERHLREFCAAFKEYERVRHEVKKYPLEEKLRTCLAEVIAPSMHRIGRAVISICREVQVGTGRGSLDTSFSDDLIARFRDAA